MSLWRGQASRFAQGLWDCQTLSLKTHFAPKAPRPSCKAQASSFQVPAAEAAHLLAERAVSG